MRLSIQEIQYVLAVEETGSITKAARKLFISQPALSQAVMKIEADIGVPLFTRDKKKMSLTEEGRLFVKSGAKIVEYVDLIESEIQKRARLTQDQLRVGIPYYLGSRIMPSALKAYRQEYPETPVFLLEKSSGQLEEELLRQTIDLAVLPLPFQSSKIEHELLFEGPMCLLMPAKPSLLCHCQGTPRRIDLTKLVDVPFLSTNAQIGQRSALIFDLMMRRAKITPKTLFVSKNFSTVKQMVACGMGVALVPSAYVSEEELSRLGLVRVLPLESQSYQWSVAVAYQSACPLSVPAKRFIRVLKDFFQQDGAAEGDWFDRGML